MKKFLLAAVMSSDFDEDNFYFLIYNIYLYVFIYNL